MKFWKISYSSSFTVSCDLSDLEWMNDTSFGDSHWFLQVKKKSGKNKLVFSIRAVNECPGDPLSNFPGWHFPGFPWQPDICAVCSCDWPPLFLLCPRCPWSKRRGFQTETGLWQAPRSDTWTHSMVHRDGGCYHGDQIAFFFFFLGALEMWCGWGSSRCGPNDVFHTSHLFLSPTLPPPLRSISLFSTIWLESIFKSKPYFGRGGTVSVSVPGFSVWTGFGNRRLFYLISRSSSFSHGRDFLQFSHQHQPSTSSFSSRPPRSHMWCSLSESGFFLCTRKCTIVSGTCSHFTCEVSRVCPPSAPDSSEWRRHQAFPVARTSPVTDAVQTRPLCSPGTKHKWVLCFVAQSSREAWASSTNLRRGCPACPPPPIPNVPSHLCKHSAADRTVVLACSLWTDCIWKCYGRSQSHSNNCSGHREEKARCTGMLTVCC